MIKLLIGGSPCTHWSIAQTKNRETTAEGIGWELFLNYVTALKKYRPDYFLYENNKSMSAAIREQITAELGVEPVLINSALVSAQNRQRLYWVGKREPDGTYSQVHIEQPEDRGILLRDILETTVSEKGYALRAECINGLPGGKSRTVDAHMGKLENNLVPRMNNPTPAKQQYDCIVEPVRIGTIENDAKNPDHDSQQYRVYSPDGKAVALCGNGVGLGAKTGLYATPAPATMRQVGRRINEQGHRDDYNEAIPHFQYFEVNDNPQKTNCLSTVQKDNMVAVPAGAGGEGKHQVYEVCNGLITVKGKQYPIKLADGFYIIRKLTVAECKRLQTVPDAYAFPVSDSQAYKMLGNGWTVDVIAHIMSHFEGLTAEPVEVLSMYDGMSCGHIALDKLGAEISAYYATEIDKYAIQTTQHNYPDTVQMGDAFQVRGDGWRLPEFKEE